MILSTTTFATWASGFENQSHDHSGHNSAQSTLTVNMSGTATAVGAEVSTYTRSLVDATHVTPSGTMRVIGDVGSQSVGQWNSSSENCLSFQAVRSGVGANPTFAVDRGIMDSSARASTTTHNEALGDMQAGGTLTGPSGSITSFSGSHGYSATSNSGPTSGHSTGTTQVVFGSTQGYTPAPVIIDVGCVANCGATATLN